MSNGKVNGIIRLVVTAVLFLNMILTFMGLNPIPFDEASFTEFATVLASGISILWSWWKNANITRAAQEGQKLTKAIKEDGLLRTEE